MYSISYKYSYIFYGKRVHGMHLMPSNYFSQLTVRNGVAGRVVAPTRRRRRTKITANGFTDCQSVRRLAKSLLLTFSGCPGDSVIRIHVQFFLFVLPRFFILFKMFKSNWKLAVNSQPGFRWDNSECFLCWCR